MSIHSVDETCKILRVTRQAVYQNIKVGAIKAEKVNGKYKIQSDDIIKFRANRYSRAKYFEGTEYISVKEAAKIKGCPEQRLYYLIYFNILRAQQKSALWYIKKTDLEGLNVKGRFKRGAKRKVYYTPEACVPI